MIGVFIVPTGVGCRIGGHAGDATPASKLIAETCDKLIIHPNVVNASDINEMSENMLYVEGDALDRVLEGKIGLKEVNSNKILVVLNERRPETINAINAARATIGSHIDIQTLDTPLIMSGGLYPDGKVYGSYSGVDELIQQIGHLNFDVLAIVTPIDVDNDLALRYFENPDMRVNPWGYVEAEVSHVISQKINKPIAHAPVDVQRSEENEILWNLLYDKVIEQSKAPELISNCYLHCVLKGLHKAPRITNRGPVETTIDINSLDFMITPTGVVGRPHKACFKAGIPVIAIEENTCAFNKRDDRIIYVDNYLEASGVVNCIRAGITVKSIRA